MTARPLAPAAGGDHGDLPDVNVWLALAVQEHPHHAAARQYWANEAAARLHFCRVTMLGLVRLLTQPRLMGPATMRRYVGAGLPARLITDAYLAAFAAACGLRLVTFDRDFGRFEGLHLLRLSPTAKTP
ncbi:MAG: hypothetical protein Q8K96_19230 [Rubrivivax sp.]|nr:hypothetical protein [Rubrivivax sp.]